MVVSNRIECHQSPLLSNAEEPFQMYTQSIKAIWMRFSSYFNGSMLSDCMDMDIANCWNGNHQVDSNNDIINVESRTIWRKFP